MKKVALVLFCVSVMAFSGTLWAQDNATDSADIGSGTQDVGDFQRGVDAIDDAADQRDEKEDFYADPANAPIPGE